MTSFQISITPSRRTATRFISKVRRSLQKALAEQRSSGMTQSEIARRIGVHRSVINRELQGRANLSIGRVAEFAFALGLEPKFELVPPQQAPYANEVQQNFSIEVKVPSDDTVRAPQEGLTSFPVQVT